MASTLHLDKNSSNGKCSVVPLWLPAQSFQPKYSFILPTRNISFFNCQLDKAAADSFMYSDRYAFLAKHSCFAASVCSNSPAFC